jgi:hypothetical protein
MSDVQIITPNAPQPPAKPDKPSRALKVTGKLKTALDLMVFGPTDGEQPGIALSLADACRATNLHYATMRKALDKPHVRQYLNAQKQVFRASVSAANISRLAEIRDTSGNAMAKLGAIKVLEGISDDPAAAAGVSRAAGVVIIIGSQAPAGTDARVINAALPAEGNADG